MKFELRWTGYLFIGMIALVSDPRSAWAAGRQQLHGHVPAALNGAPKLGPLENSQRLDLTLHLPLRDQAGLQQFLRDLHDPRSPRYRRFLTPDQFAQAYGPAEEDYRKLADFALSHNLSIVAASSDHQLLEVNGTVSDIQKAFHVGLSRYQRMDGSSFYAPQNEPSLDLDVPLSHISGLDDFQRPRPLVGVGASRVFDGKKLQGPPGISPLAQPNAGTAPSGLYWGADFRNAYAPGVCLTGTGQSVALIEFEGYYASDIQGYETLTGLPNVPLVNVLVGGFSGKPQKSDSNGIIEVSLDIEMAVAMSPGLGQVRVYEVSPTASNATADMMLKQIATDDISNQISCSWTGFGDSATGAIFQQYDAQGQAFFQAAGDSGAYVAGDPESIIGPPIDLSAQVDMTVVGGTMLTLNSGTYMSETTWNAPLGGVTYGGGGGICSVVAIPSYQQTVNMTANGGSTIERNIPDVSMVAYNIFVTANKSYVSSTSYTYYTVVGTSAAAPLWAGFLALANQQGAGGGVTVGFANPALYAIGQGGNYGSDFNDIKDGSTNNLNGKPNFYKAVTGYDLATGWGSPKGQAMINALTGLPPLACVPSSTPTSTASGTPTSSGTSTPSRTPTGTPSSTATFSPTRTPTQTQTATASQTSTPSPVSTATFSATFSPTGTSTPTASLTATFSPTQTLTATPSNSPSPTPTQTPSKTFTVTSTLTPTSTSTDSPSPTATATASNTPSSSPTPSWTASFSSTMTPSSTPSSTPTSTLVSTATKTPSNTPTSTASSTGTFTPSNTWTSTPTETATSTSTHSATDTATSTASSTGTFTPSNTSTPTPTRTATSTSTSSATDTSTSTASSTPTPTATHTSTQTPTSTATSTSTSSATDTSTSTASSTPTSTATHTSTHTPSSTATSTSTSSATETATSTASSTPTLTASDTSTNTPSSTPTASRTSTPTNSSTSSATSSPTSSATSTLTNTPTDSPSATASSTASNTPSWTASQTPTASSTSTGTVTSTRTPSQTATFTLSNTPTNTPTFTVTLTSTDSPTDTFTPSSTAIASYTSTPTVTPGGTGAGWSVLPNVSRGGEPILWKITLTEPSPILLRIYDVSGELVDVIQQEGAAGSNELTWNLQNRSGQRVASGIYLFTVDIARGFPLPKPFGKILVLK